MCSEAYEKLRGVVDSLEGFPTANVCAAYEGLRLDPAGAFQAAMCTAIDLLTVADRQAKDAAISACDRAIEAATADYHLACASTQKQLLEGYERVLARDAVDCSEMETTLSAALVESEDAKKNYVAVTGEILAASRRLADERYAAMLATIAALEQIVRDLVASD